MEEDYLNVVAIGFIRSGHSYRRGCNCTLVIASVSEIYLWMPHAPLQRGFMRSEGANVLDTSRWFCKILICVTWIRLCTWGPCQRRILCQARKKLTFCNDLQSLFRVRENSSEGAVNNIFVIVSQERSKTKLLPVSRVSLLLKTSPEIAVDMPTLYLSSSWSLGSLWTR